ncbi:maleylacetate reductase [Chelatococcus asaccharovorans]|uniref:Maleylacetate reductase n=1 Tax=Chelatococcus asaccharovorans TaxID=28210 RepID=A0A2V3U1E7_9HYPH|nr:maleylacetate reductase [Chelatococcus asaccharovorans]MBS7704507.1 maleylacetate reductase [Chelatococcus asaccharovorans]PXW55612.1 maleylacetate reductase [Chelatococcus asaccharovorans]
MIRRFEYNARPARIIFGPGAVARLADEITASGCRRALLLSTPGRRKDAEAIARALDSRAAGLFAGAAMHTPVAVTEQAMQVFAAVNADCVVAFGGGSTIGLGKAIAYRNGATQFVIVTTYAGSEVTPVLGQTENGLKTTVLHSRILPDVVLYDPELTLDLPVETSVNSALNAMAHAVEGLYAQDRNPLSSLSAVEGIRSLLQALPIIARNPRDIDARGQALYGSWLCGTVLGTVGMALHHKLCHTLGGSFGLPHAETHAVLLPHCVAYNMSAAAEALAPLAAFFKGSIAGGLHDFATSLGAPRSLRELGLQAADLDRAAELAVRNPYWNPRPVEKEPIRDVLRQAWEGRRPQ